MVRSQIKIKNTLFETGGKVALVIMAESLTKLYFVQ